jgi:hypothetical protein
MAVSGCRRRAALERVRIDVHEERGEEDCVDRGSSLLPFCV